MFDWDKWQEIFDILRKHKLRTGLTAFGVFWGIFMLVILLGFGTGFGNKIDAIFGSAKNVVLIWPANVTQMPFRGLAKGRKILLTQADVDAIRLQVTSVKEIDGRNNLGGGAAQLVVHKQANDFFNVVGSHSGWEAFEFIKLTSGRYINLLDEREKRKVAVIGVRVRDVLFKDTRESAVGKTLQINGVEFTVVGVYQSNLPDANGPHANSSIYLPNETLRYTFNELHSFSALYFTPQPGYSSYDVEKDVKAFLYARHKIHPDERGVLITFNAEEIYQQNKNLVTGVIAFSWLVAIGTILSGVIGVSNIMLVAVRERTREIGLRKALGATPTGISFMIIHESLAITAIAGYSGLVVGVFLLELITSFLVTLGRSDGMFASPFIDIGTAIIALVVLVVSGVMAALLPAIKASSVDPIIALQDE